MHTLFICRANAGRSQMAEAFYNQMTGTKDATSAGVDLKNSVKGEDPGLPDLVLVAMQEVGHDLSGKVRKEVTKEMAEGAGRIVVIGNDYPLPSYVSSSSRLISWPEIPDAVRTPIEFHRNVRDMVRARVEELIRSDGSTQHLY